MLVKKVFKRKNYIKGVLPVLRNTLSSKATRDTEQDTFAYSTLEQFDYELLKQIIYQLVRTDKLNMGHCFVCL